DGVLLEVDVEPELRVVRERLVEPDRPLPGAVPEPGRLGPGELRERAAAVGRAVEGGVVEEDDDAVGGAVDIGLEVAVPEAGGVLERRPGVLGDLGPSPAVGERDRPGPAQVGHRAAGRRPGQGAVHCVGWTMVSPSEARNWTGSTVVP